MNVARDIARHRIAEAVVDALRTHTVPELVAALRATADHLELIDAGKEGR